jgi:lipopolysaccharide exporter
MIDKFRAVLESKLPPGSFIRNVVTLMTGTTFAQALIILVAPILTRLYAPESYGVSALYGSILGIFSVIACWRYELAIVLPEKDEDAANLLVLSICICFGMAVLTLILVALFRNQVANLLGAPELAPWLWFIPLSLIAAGLFTTFNYWSTRRKQFRRLAARTITQSTVTAAAQLGTGALYPAASAGGLIGGAIVGQLTATGRLAWQIARDEGEQIRSAINKLNMKQMLIRYKDFPLYSSWSGLLNTASTMLPALLLGYFFTPAVVGYYALGHRVLAMPMGVVGGSIAQVFFPRANEAKHKGDLDRLTLDMFQRLLAIGFVPILLITIVAPDLFAVIFGERWWTAGEYVRWLSLWLLFVFISSPLSNIYAVMERQRDGLIVNTIMFSTRLLALIIGGIKGDALFTIALFGITGAILWIGNCTYILHLAGIPAQKAYVTIIKQIVRGMPYALFPIVVWYVSHNSLAFVLAGIGSGCIFLVVQAYSIKKTGALI